MFVSEYVCFFKYVVYLSMFVLSCMLIEVLFFKEWAHKHFTKFYGYTSNPDYTPGMPLTTLYFPMRGQATQEPCRLILDRLEVDGVIFSPYDMHMEV
jgi:hypothetical protein